MAKSLNVDDNKVLRIMAGNGLTTKTLAARYGVTYSRMCAILNARCLTIGTLKKLADAMGCDPMDIVAD